MLAAAAYGVEAVVLAIVLTTSGARAQAPVVATFRAGQDAVTAVIATVDLGYALVALLAGGAVAHALAAASARSEARAAAAQASRTSPATRGTDALLVAGWSQGAAILTFLVAQANGIAELTSLVPIYAATGVAVVLVGIDPGTAPTWRRPGAWGAVVGIVPWGVIGFSQIGAGVAAGDVGIGVRAVTLAALAIVAVGWVCAWRRTPATSARALGTMTVGLSVVAWLAVAMLVLA
ncbi:hypothetical protein EV279_0349 [Microbacterium sp. BK668]|nr:hypothetical protein EV279_0349 [Microbacterium sp. BK668]